MKPSFRLFTIGGIEIGVHYTWVFAFILIAWSLASGAYPDLFPRWSKTEYWAAGIASSLVLFASVLAHELAHSFTARGKGLPVKGITLFIFGGVSSIGAEPKRAWDEFVIAVVGPLSSILIGALLFLLWKVLQPDAPMFIWKLSTSAQSRSVSPFEGVIYYSAYINVVVGIFNLLPGFPLDGGRVLRSVVWGATGSMRKATGVAATSGRLFGWTLIGLGLWFVLSGNFLGGLWMAFIGWFLSSAADSTRREQEAEYELSGGVVRDVMQPGPITVPPNMAVNELVQECFIKRGCRAAPVVDSTGRLLGVVSLTDVRRLGVSEWPNTAVTAIMTRDPLHTLTPGENLDTALRLLAEKDINQAIVVDGGRVVGVISREGLVRYVRLRREFRMPAETRAH